MLPESLPRERRTARFDWKHARPMGGVRMLLEHPRIWALVAVVFIANFAHYVYPSTFVLFADAAYGWKEKQAGYVLAAVGVCSVIVNVALVGRLVKAMGERRAMLLGLACGIAGFVLYGLAGGGLGVPHRPADQRAVGGGGAGDEALITRQVPANEQGRIQGSLGSLVSLAGIVAPALFAGSFGFFIGPRAPVHLPGVAFLIAALLLAIAAGVAWRYTDRAHLAGGTADAGTGAAESP